MAVEGVGTLFHQYSKFKSEKYPWLHTPLRNHVEDTQEFFHIGMQNLAECCDFHSSLVEGAFEGPKWADAEERQLKWKCPIFTKPFNTESGMTKAVPY